MFRLYIMKRNIHIVLVIIGFLFAQFNSVHSQKVPEAFSNAFLQGNAELVSGYFHDRLQINVLDQEYICSKTHGKEILRDFFTKNKPTAFKIIHEGGKTESNWSIGSLSTSSGNYRVNIFFRKIDDKNLIHLLRIEKDDAKTF
jgi:hypothetical protein